MSSPADVVQNQLVAYNAHDVEAFLGHYAPDATVVSPDGTTMMTGHEAIRAQYAGLFAQYPDVQAEVPNRLQVREWVVDEEHVHLGGQELEVLLAYEVADGLIKRVLMLSSP